MNKIKVGDIINTHGVKGEIKIRRTGAENFKRDILYFIGEDFTKVEIEKSNIHKGFFIVKLKNYDNINQVLKFKGDSIFIDETNLIKLNEDEYYVKDLIGLDVYNQDEEYIGKLVEVLEYAANDVYIVENDEKQYNIPAVSEFIKDINLIDNRISVKLIEGM